jgi:hypothetical protein
MTTPNFFRRKETFHPVTTTTSKHTCKQIRIGSKTRSGGRLESCSSASDWCAAKSVTWGIKTDQTFISCSYTLPGASRRVFTSSSTWPRVTSPDHLAGSHQAILSSFILLSFSPSTSSVLVRRRQREQSAQISTTPTRTNAHSPHKG